MESDGKFLSDLGEISDIRQCQVRNCLVFLWVEPLLSECLSVLSIAWTLKGLVQRERNVSGDGELLQGDIDQGLGRTNDGVCIRYRIKIIAMVIMSRLGLTFSASRDVIPGFTLTRHSLRNRMP